MSPRCLASVGVLGIVVAAVSVSVAGQVAKPAAESWTPIRTGWGDPDLQGVWSYATTTPLSRPDGQDKQVLTDEEVAELAAATASRQDAPPRPGDPCTYNNFWFDRGQSIERTSLIVDPPDGKLPALTPQAEKERAARAEYQGAHPADSYLDRSPTET